MSIKPASLLRQITHGVYVIGVADNRRVNAFTAAWIMQISFDPLLLALSINPRHSSYRLLNTGGVCSVNVLSHDQFNLAQHCGTLNLPDKLVGVKWRRGSTGAPILTDALAYLDCKVSHYCDAGDHKLVICKVVDGDILNPRAVPMLYCDTGDLDGSSALYPANF